MSIFIFAGCMDAFCTWLRGEALVDYFRPTENNIKIIHTLLTLSLCAALPTSTFRFEGPLVTDFALLTGLLCFLNRPILLICSPESIGEEPTR